MCARVLRTAERAIEFIDTPYLAVRRPSEVRRHREDKHLCEEKSPDLVRRYLQRERQRAVAERGRVQVRRSRRRDVDAHRSVSHGGCDGDVPCAAGRRLGPRPRDRRGGPAAVVARDF